jgi:hypothetical protein
VEGDHRLAGYYVWSVSATLVFMACRLRWPPFVAMLLLSAWFVHTR